MDSLPIPKISDIEPYLSGESRMSLDFCMGNLEPEDRLIDWSSPYDTACLLNSKGEGFAGEEVLRLTTRFRSKQREYAP